MTPPLVDRSPISDALAEALPCARSGFLIRCETQDPSLPVCPNCTLRLAVLAAIIEAVNAAVEEAAVAVAGFRRNTIGGDMEGADEVIRTLKVTP